MKAFNTCCKSANVIRYIDISKRGNDNSVIHDRFCRQQHENKNFHPVATINNAYLFFADELMPGGNKKSIPHIPRWGAQKSNPQEFAQRCGQPSATFPEFAI